MEKKQPKQLFFALLLLTIAISAALPISNVVDSGWPRFFRKHFFDKLFSMDLFESHFNRQLFDRGISGKYKDVLVGKDGWLYLNDYHGRGLARGRDIIRASDAKIDRWLASMLARKQWLASQGIPMVFAIAPNKHSIYPEHLPDWASIAHPNSTDRLVARAQKLGFDIVDGRDELIKQKQQHANLYTRGDTHWSELGAYFAYRLIMQEVSRQLEDIDYVQYKDFKFEARDRDAGDLANMLKIHNLLGEAYDVRHRIDFEGIHSPICVTRLDKKFEAKKKCKHYLNRRINIHKYNYIIDNVKAKNDITAMIFRDSFGQGHNRLLNDAFSKTFHLRYTKVKNEKAFKRLIRDKRPDLVIYQVVERSLYYHRLYDFEKQSKN